MRRLFLIWCFLLLTASSILSFQTVDLTRMAKEVSFPVPVVFGKKNDGLPEKLEITGRITAVSFSRACGGVYWSGTIKLELLQKVKNYPHRNLFVVVNCLEDSENEKKYLNKVVRLKASKLYPEYTKFRDPESFYFELIDNTIDSGGMPFYCTNAGGREILDK